MRSIALKKAKMIGVEDEHCACAATLQASGAESADTALRASSPARISGHWRSRQRSPPTTAAGMYARGPTAPSTERSRPPKPRPALRCVTSPWCPFLSAACHHASTGANCWCGASEQWLVITGWWSACEGIRHLHAGMRPRFHAGPRRCPDVESLEQSSHVAQRTLRGFNPMKRFSRSAGRRSIKCRYTHVREIVEGAVVNLRGSSRVCGVSAWNKDDHTLSCAREQYPVGIA